MSRSQLRTMLRLALVLVGGLAPAWLAPVQAQDEPATGGFIIRVYTCEREPARSVGVASAADPEECVRVDGVTVHVAAPDGRPIAACVTGEIRPTWGDCAVSIPADLRVVVTEDTTTLPVGYLPRQNPIFTVNYTEFASAIFVNLPADQVAADPTATATPVVSPTPRPELTASLTIHNRRCPLEFLGSDFYGACHQHPIADTTFRIDPADAVEAVTDAAGDVTFAALPPGRAVVSGGPPGDFVRNAIVCAGADRPGTRYPFTRLTNVEISLYVVPSWNLICDWFSVPEYRGAGPIPTPDPAWLQPAGGETLTIHGKTCPEDAVADCPGTPVIDARYRLEHLASGVQLSAAAGEAAANAAGTVAFDLSTLGAGPVRVTGVTSAIAGDASPLIVCTAADGALVRPANLAETTPGAISFEVRLRPGDRAHCVILYR